MSVVHLLLPWDIDDEARPSGGNVYDRRVSDGLRALGWEVSQTADPVPDALGGIADDEVVLLDGWLAAPSAAALETEGHRLRVVILVHMLLGPGDAGEARALRAAAAVITTSRWARRRLLEWYDLPAGHVRVAEPGVDTSAQVASGTSGGGSLLCVGAVTAAKGYDLLVAALADLADLDWTCTCVGPLDVDPDFVTELRATLGRSGLTERVSLVGPRSATALDSTYADADLLVLASRAESYAMVVTEALAHGLPVVAADVGGVSEALGRTAGKRPGVLVPPSDPAALAKELRRWLGDSEQRARLRGTAAARRLALGDWEQTAALVSGVLTEVTS